MRRTIAYFGLLALWLPACGAAGSAPPASPADSQPSSLRSEESYATVDEAEQGLRRAQADAVSLREALQNELDRPVSVQLKPGYEPLDVYA